MNIDQVYEEYKRTHHHPWCNYYMTPREGCKMCEQFYEKYPLIKEGEMLSVDDLLMEHFPSALVRDILTNDNP